MAIDTIPYGPQSQRQKTGTMLIHPDSYRDADNLAHAQKAFYPVNIPVTYTASAPSPRARARVCQD